MQYAQTLKTGAVTYVTLIPHNTSKYIVPASLYSYPKVLAQLLRCGALLVSVL